MLVQGGRFGGWALYFKDGKPTYTYNYLGMQTLHRELRHKRWRPARRPCASTSPTTAAALGKGGAATLTVNGAKVAEARIPMTQAMMFSADETADVGMDDATPVVESVGRWQGIALHRQDRQGDRGPEIGATAARSAVRLTRLAIPLPNAGAREGMLCAWTDVSAHGLESL